MRAENHRHGPPDVKRSRGGVRIANVSLTTGDGSVDVGFDIGWSGSWRFPEGGARGGNWDAAWVFVKYSITESAELEDTPAVREALGRGDARALLGAARLVGRKPEELLYWLGGHLEITTVERKRRWAIVQEKRAHQHAYEADERSVEQIDVSLRLPHGGAPGRIVLRKPGRYRHLAVSTIDADHTAPRGATIRAVPEGTGVFIHRSGDNLGEGAVQFDGVRLRHAFDSARDDFMTEVTLWVFALEMVYVPEGRYQLGDPLGPLGPANCFYDALKCADDEAGVYQAHEVQAPVQALTFLDSGAGEEDKTLCIDSEDALEVAHQLAPGDADKRLYYSDNAAIGCKGDQAGPVPAEFPKGYRSFYLMKRQITQAEYADFVNALHGSAKTSRFPYWTGNYRYEIFWHRGGVRVAQRPTRACNWLSWIDGVCYAAWAGLRPMTELEYEKACRGPARPIPGEFAWGSTALEPARVIVGDEDGSEIVNGNCNVENSTSPFTFGDGGSGPVRDDAFASPGADNADAIFPESRARFTFKKDKTFERIPTRARECTGASYYGVMGLSGNLWEWCVTVGKQAGRRFTGAHGAGALDDYGVPDLEALRWPGADADGAGVRGGSWYTTRAEARVADRSYASGLIGFYSARSHDFGFRCARTAPDE